MDQRQRVAQCIDGEVKITMATVEDVSGFVGDESPT